MSTLMFLCFLSTAFVDKQIPVDLGVSHVVVQVADDYTASRPINNDLGRVRMSVKANVGELFNWNVKQLFILLAAEIDASKIERQSVRFRISFKIYREKVIHTKPGFPSVAGFKVHEDVVLYTDLFVRTSL
nr:unnamed protein product [Spirometra erinaceieuropaei]